MMRITGLNHITINVTDLEASLRFYTDVLELQELNEIDMGDHTLTYFELPQHVRLELLNFCEKGPVIRHRENADGIYRHFCLETDDLEELAERCRNSHVIISKEPSYVEKLGCSTMLLIDPNGVEIEAIQR